MKLKATKKDITNNFCRIYLIDYPYGFLPAPVACNSGYLGWNWNAYDLGTICLIEGNRNFPKHRRLTESATQIVKKYEQEVAGANFSARVKIDKKYLDMFIMILMTTERS